MFWEIGRHPISNVHFTFFFLTSKGYKSLPKY